MIAGGGGYDGPAALKNRTSEVYGFNKKRKKEACIGASTGLQLAGCRGVQ